MARFLRRLPLQVFLLMAAASFLLPPAFGQEGRSPLSPAAAPEMPALAPLNLAFLNHFNVGRPLDIQNVAADGHGLGLALRL
jgi:hypothetical protein